MADKFFDNLLGLAGGAVDACGWADGELSKIVIDALVGTTRNRPHPWSTYKPYTSWKGLTDRTYQARHLPPAAPRLQPAEDAVKELFARPAGVQTLSPKSTCLFPAFAQYLTDGFIRTKPLQRDQTTSNHEIDLCPLYGRTEDHTQILRLLNETSGKRGRLKSQILNNEEYPPYLYTRDGSAIDPTFKDLDPPLFGPEGKPSPERLATLFAVGGDRANSTPYTAMMNTLFLREHNRIAGELDTRNPDWDDERVFQTARNILIPMFIKIVVEQYINHITPTPFNLTADPKVAWAAKWNRPNWITAEFSLVYRWHSLMPDTIEWPSRSIALENFGLDNSPLIDVGLKRAFLGVAAQPAAELGALNTSQALLDLETLAVRQARGNQLDTYNAYRQAFSMPPAKQVSDITSDPRIAAILTKLYPNGVDDIEFYPGLFAEDRVHQSPLPGLLLRMVGVDAFSQALTNPLLSEHVFNETTFTPWGFQLIHDTKCLGDIMVRQGMTVDRASVTMTQPSWSYGWHVP